MLAHIKAINQLHLLQHTLHRGGTYDHELAIYILRLFLYQNQKGLKDRVGESWANMYELDKTL